MCSVSIKIKRHRPPSLIATVVGSRNAWPAAWEYRLLGVRQEETCTPLGGVRCGQAWVPGGSRRLVVRAKASQSVPTRRSQADNQACLSERWRAGVSRSRKAMRKRSKPWLGLLPKIDGGRSHDATFATQTPNQQEPQNHRWQGPRCGSERGQGRVPDSQTEFERERGCGRFVASLP